MEAEDVAQINEDKLIRRMPFVSAVWSKRWAEKMKKNVKFNVMKVFT